MTHVGITVGLTCVQQAGGGGGEPVLAEIDFSDNTEITEYVNNDVTEVTGNVLFTGCVALANLECPNLTIIRNNLNLDGTDALTLPDFSALSVVEGIVSWAFIASAGSLSLPALTALGFLNVGNNDGAVSFTAPLLATATAIAVYSNPNLTELTLGLTSVLGGDGLAGITITDNSQLVEFTLSGLMSCGGNIGIVLSGNAFNEAAVDAILVRVAAMDGTGGTTSFDNLTIDISGGTNAIPSAAGLTAKATLEGRGCTVTVNE